MVGAAYNSVGVYLSDGSGNWTLGGRVPYSGNISFLASADLDGNGKADLVIAGSAGKVAVYLGAGYAVFGPPTSYTVGTGAADVAIADLNGDGIPDLISANSSSNSISTLLGLGGGAFGAARSFSVGSNPSSIAVSDFDGDGEADVVVANSSGANFALLLGDGAGAFRSLTLFSTTTSPLAVAAADFDGDGHADVSATVGGAPPGPASLMIFQGDGSGGFTSGAPYPLAGSPAELLAADLNGDARPDLVIGGSLPGGVSVWMNDGSGHFSVPAGYSVGYSNGLAAADFNGDGLLDLASSSGGAVAVLLNTSCKVRHLGIAQDVSTCNFPGTAFVSQPTVAVYDDGDNVVSCAAGNVGASIAPGTGTPGASLGGTTVVSLSEGLAAYTNLSVSVAGGGYQLLFSHAQAGSTRSRSFPVGGPSNITISGPSAVCSAQAPSYHADPAYDTYAWRWTGPAWAREGHSC